MKIGIMTDSHENMPQIAKAVELFNREGVGHVLHAGDIISPITSREFKKLDCPFTAVFGNNDGDRLFLREKFQGIGEIHKGRFEGEFGGKRLIMMHEPDALEAIAASGHYDIAVYGHTHDTDIRRVGETLVINPGESGRWLRGKSTVVILDTGTMETDLVDLDKISAR